MRALIITLATFSFVVSLGFHAFVFYMSSAWDGHITIVPWLALWTVGSATAIIAAAQWKKGDGSERN